MFAAFDNRIDAVVSSSGGTGAESTFRYSDDRFNSESVEEITGNFPHWFIYRLHWFTGREDKLPVDQNSLISIIAPRPVMLESAITEDQGNPWGIEQTYKSVKKIYDFLGVDSSIAILLRGGRHQHSLRDMQRYLDFFDHAFGRGHMNMKRKNREYYDYLYYDYSFKKWKQQKDESINPLNFPVVSKKHTISFMDKVSLFPKQDSLRKKIRWLLGKRPPEVANKTVFSPKINANHTYKDDYLSEVIGQVNVPDNIKKMRFGPYTPLGENLWATMFFPANVVHHNSVAKKLPVVIYLHGLSYATGFHRRSADIIEDFVSQGYAVLAFDMIGFGTRIQEARHFYQRYPHWSKMGDMVTNVLNIISDVQKRMPFIDSNHIYLVGYSLGGTVALLAGALDPRVAGVAEVAGFSSLRYDKKSTGNFRRYWKIHGLMPRLGFFARHRNRIPIDFKGIISCMAPRPLLIIAPERDRDHSIGSVKNIVEAISKVYKGMNARKQLTFFHPDTFNHFIKIRPKRYDHYTNHMKAMIENWLLHQKRKW
jgi:pimeloyl-ACP methyl ester carboxylesterase